MVSVLQIHPLSDFVRNPKAHVAKLKQNRIPEVLTVNGRAEVVLLDPKTYESLMARIRFMEDAEDLRAAFRRNREKSDEPALSPEEIERRHQVVDELMAETERLGLYK